MSDRPYVLALDQGTTSSRCILFDRQQNIVGLAQREFGQHYPKPGWVEHDPMEIYSSQYSVLTEVLAQSGVDPAQVAGIGVGGQMHGLVALDDQGQVLRPAILWNDGRTAPQVDWLNHRVGREVLSRHTANIAFAGFTAPKLLWMQKNEPELFRRIDELKLRFHPDTAGVLAALEEGDLAGVSRRMFNVFEEALPAQRRAVVEEIKSTLLSRGALGACMSGTGPTVFGIFDNAESARSVADELKQSYAETFLTKNV